MKLEDICISLEHAIKLKELGLEQNGIFKYFVNYKGDSQILFKGTILGETGKYYSAFTTEELMKILPQKVINYDGESFYLIVIKEQVYYEAKYATLGHNNIIFLNVKTELLGNLKISNCLAELLIWIIENKYVEVKDGKIQEL